MYSDDEHLQRIDRTVKYKGSILNIYDDVIKTPDERVIHYDTIGHKGASAILPVLDDGRILLVKQWRNAIDRFTWEIPAGGRDSVDEPFEICASRELDEETGYTSETLSFLHTIIPVAAYSQERIDVYIAKNLKKTQQILDDDEYINVKAFTLEELLEMIEKNIIQDSKTVASILKYSILNITQTTM